MKVGSRFAAFAGIVAAFMGAAAPGTRSTMPPPAIVRSKEDEKAVRRLLRRPRAVIMRRSLTWRGYGLRAIGRRWPDSKPVQATGAFSRTSDRQIYAHFTDGSVRRVPSGPRGKAAVKLAKRLRHAARHAAAGGNVQQRYW